MHNVSTYFYLFSYIQTYLLHINDTIASGFVSDPTISTTAMYIVSPFVWSQFIY